MDPLSPPEASSKACRVHVPSPHLVSPVEAPGRNSVPPICPQSSGAGLGTAMQTGADGKLKHLARPHYWRLARRFSTDAPRLRISYPPPACQGKRRSAQDRRFLTQGRGLGWADHHHWKSAGAEAGVRDGRLAAFAAPPSLPYRPVLAPAPEIRLDQPHSGTRGSCRRHSTISGSGRCRSLDTCRQRHQRCRTHDLPLPQFPSDTGRIDTSYRA